VTLGLCEVVCLTEYNTVVTCQGASISCCAQLAAFIMESLQSCGGQIIPPQGYMAEAFRFEQAQACSASLVCIAHLKLLL